MKNSKSNKKETEQDNELKTEEVENGAASANYDKLWVVKEIYDKDNSNISMMTTFSRQDKFENLSSNCFDRQRIALFSSREKAVAFAKTWLQKVMSHNDVISNDIYQLISSGLAKKYPEICEIVQSKLIPIPMQMIPIACEVSLFAKMMNATPEQILNDIVE